jgi:hypothetical protein
MFNSDTELLFPSRVIPELRDIRDEPWQSLIDRVTSEGQDTVSHLAFVLLMVRLGGCATCHADSFKALKGCTKCACLTVRRFRGSDHELVELFEESLEEVELFLEEKTEQFAAF